MEEKKTSKIDIGLHISRNYNKVVLELKDEPIEYENEAELKAKIRRIYGILAEEVELEFDKISKR